ncbi:MAG TPA: hypothetical protein VEA61_14720 [Allosphingosinicella sp.]|nr:hypothetical protein [Allosphingosinicella sp.]
MGRVIVGIVLGIVTAFVTVFAIDMIGHQIYPLPSDLNMYDPEAVGAFITTMPAGALAMVVIAWLVGAFDGGVIAVLISRRAWTVWPVAAAVAAAGVVNVLIIPHPVLLQIGAVVAPLFGGLAAAIAARRLLAPATGTAE